ncbi:MAG: phosphoenolpyruvate synthase [Bacteroidetes bacterium]|nr:phosphoenolpyruvate synthase [Bacteroidota bacterium]
MRYFLNTEKECAKDFVVGGKARNLFRMAEIGMNVPKFAVIPQEELISLVPEDIRNSDYKSIIDFIDRISIPEEFIRKIRADFPGTEYFAVRSSAIDEDGSEFSFAGQFESHLFVKEENIAAKIKRVWCSAFSERVFEYRKNNKLEQKFGIAVIIQEMIDAEVAGVAFGINPMNGNKNEKLISSVYGLGEGLVSGELNSDNYTLTREKINSQLTEKTHKIILDSESSGGTRMAEVEKVKQNIASLDEQKVYGIGRILDQLFSEYKKPQDIEFAFRSGELFLLQARPITTLNKFNDQSGDYILWDNSNIIESYPGITTPLTFSFISKSYEGAYRLFGGFMGVSEKTQKQNERVFANTLGLINGRVYYNLKTWYHMLAMLPGYSINARFMEKMMGVKERFDIPETYRLTKGKAWWSIVKMIGRMYMRFISLPRKRRAFMKLLNETISHYKKINYSEKNANELMQLYLEFERTLLNEWKAPLLNDFFAMIWFGLLQKRCVKYGLSKKNQNIHNDLLCGSSDIISIQPIHRSIALATSISSDEELKKLFIHENEKTIWKNLSENKAEKYRELKTEIDRYISDFGERCIGELKLETVSYTQDPAKFIKILKSYVETGITLKTTSGKIEEELRANAEKEVNATLQYNIYRKWKLKRTLSKARALVSSRENLRYERTRAFGIVREIFSNMGTRFYSDGIIENARDIFYLTREEIFCFIEGTSVTQNIKALIQLRKTEFENYQKQDIPSERFATYGTVYHANDFFSLSRVNKVEGDLKGIGCCPGRVKAKVKVILNPDEVSSLDGDILVTSSTDPGWVTLFPSASGIIVERGSLLSHSAIVSREMGKPCIVSVTGLLKTLKTGDEIEMDGSSGEIKIIQKA